VSESGGNWRTATGSTSAAAVGTQWHTTLTCAGTRIRVVQGIVAVRDRVHQRTVVLRAGQSRLFTSSDALEGR
jgi:ferric-dicitrate binding protein FerR (iron transport regulator)